MSTGIQPPLCHRADDLSDESPALVDPVRSDIWYDDGNVILEAEATQFKVYRGALAEASSVFKDMFSFPQPASETIRAVEGCSVVQLSDTAEDVTFILQALYQRKYVAFGGKTGAKLPFGIVSAFLRLGQKYDIRPLYFEGRNRAFEDIPVTLAVHDSLKDRTAVDSTELIPLVALARKTGLLSTLPYLLYRCCVEYSAKKLMAYGPAMPDQSTDTLSHQDQLACLAGHPVIYKAQAHTTYTWLSTVQINMLGTCARPKLCKEAKRTIRLQTFRLVPKIIALDLWSSDLSTGLCKECSSIAHAKHDAGRAEFWEQLPAIFDLPPWSELLKERPDIIQSHQASALIPSRSAPPLLDVDNGHPTSSQTATHRRLPRLP
ncbi:hypothetical protein FIBSPDRAFT_935715 [Athelia psychrophila]|uniref:BTB domain-containing protein n=1 Tax=Athelia psychrophila TaxID=1759441 RepID=A0A166DAK8_9AGAM|nr:hypothetical protein FIBSPDRAFT_935715 [Fibularhizoctonia sp. CBS 109695]